MTRSRSQEPGWSRSHERSALDVTPEQLDESASGCSARAMSSFALRFAVEVAFLVLLALAVGLAELATPWIVAVMVIGWVLVAVIEWLAWQSEQEPVDDVTVCRSGSTSRGSDVVGSRRDPCAAARGRQVRPVLVQRLLASARPRC